MKGKCEWQLNIRLDNCLLHMKKCEMEMIIPVENICFFLIVMLGVMPSIRQQKRLNINSNKYICIYIYTCVCEYVQEISDEKNDRGFSIVELE